MPATLDRRIARFLEQRERERRAAGGSEDHPDHQRRVAHDRVLKELPRLVSKISSAVAELNDLTSQGDISIKFEAANHTPSAEAVYTLSVVGREEKGPTLLINVDYTGTLRSMLRSHETRSLLESASVFSIERSDLMNLLVALLEAQYQ